MKRLLCLYILGTLLGLISLGGWANPADAQTMWNRELQTIAVLPNSGGTHSVFAVWTVDVEPTSIPLNLSTIVELQIGGTTVAVQTFIVGIDAGSGQACGSGPPCFGSCGSGTLNGGAWSLLCYKDGECTPSFCDCDCGQWITADLGPQPIAPGDEIAVLLRPGPGALPDSDTSDDSARTMFHGQPVGWDRAIESAFLVETSPGMFDIHAAGSVAWETFTRYLNLDFIVQVDVNGTTVASTRVPASAIPFGPEPCWLSGCGSQCGTFNGIPRYCDPFLWWGCSCVGGWITIFPNVPLVPGDEITVSLMPDPGAFPELPLTNFDDEMRLRCCDMSSVNDPASRESPRQLGQNQPNPFASMSSISLNLEQGGMARVDVFSTDGRRVRTLLDRTLGPGQWSITWDGRDEAGEPVPAGTYFYELTHDGRSETRKMTVLK